MMICCPSSINPNSNIILFILQTFFVVKKGWLKVIQCILDDSYGEISSKVLLIYIFNDVEKFVLIIICTITGIH